MTEYKEQLRRIAADTELQDTPDLARAIYERYYCSPRTQRSAGTTTREERRDFVSQLSVANCGTENWQAGWRFLNRSDAGLEVTKDGVRFYACESDVRFETDCQAGAACRVRMGKELRALVPGYYCALGDAEESADRNEPRFRIYWNLRASGAAQYVADMTKLLNNHGVPFRTKVLSDPEGYSRADAGVLYLDRRDIDAAAPIVKTLARRFQPALEDNVPMFTRPLARGVALAEDPGGDESFGQSRCRIVAKALHESGATTLDARLDAMCKALKTAKIDPDEPYLCGGTSAAFATFFV